MSVDQVWVRVCLLPNNKRGMVFSMFIWPLWATGNLSYLRVSKSSKQGS